MVEIVRGGLIPLPESIVNKPSLALVLQSVDLGSLYSGRTRIPATLIPLPARASQRALRRMLATSIRGRLQGPGLAKWRNGHRIGYE